MEKGILDLFLCGNWKGEGKVNDKIEYIEELNIENIKQNIYTYNQKTINKQTNGKMHSETGFLKIIQDCENSENYKVELSLVHPFSLCEIEEGKYGNEIIELETKQIIRGSANSNDKIVTKLKRIFQKEDNSVISYEVFLSTNQYQDQPHLKCRLVKQI